MIGFRVSAYDTPCPPSPSRRDSRWGRGGGMVVNYWSLHPHGPWAELYRGQGMRDADEVLGQVRSRVWVGRFDHIRATVIDPSSTGSHGLTAADLVDDDWTACQAAGERLATDGHDAVLVPSAALPGTTTLVLFGQRLAVPYDAEPIDGIDIPCAVIADRAPGVPSVLPAVRHVGDAPERPYVQQLPTPLP